MLDRPTTPPAGRGNPKENHMGKIVSNFFITLDGVVESPDQWQLAYFNEEMGAAIGRAAEGFTVFLMGRVLYEEWAAYRPNQGDDVPFASFINNAPKYVASNTFTDATWNNTTIVSGDVLAQLKELRDRTQGSIGMSGSATLVRWLMANDLLDELNLMIHPIAVGHGQRLFADGPSQPLQLVSHDVFTTGVLNVVYVPADQ
jgi:dihydrofolate reductase